MCSTRKVNYPEVAIPGCSAQPAQQQPQQEPPPPCAQMHGRQRHGEPLKLLLVEWGIPWAVAKVSGLWPVVLTAYCKLGKVHGKPQEARNARLKNVSFHLSTLFVMLTLLSS